MGFVPEEAGKVTPGRVNKQDAHIIRMRFFEGQTLAEIGKAMDVSRYQFRWLKTKALINLRIELGILTALMSR